MKHSLFSQFLLQLVSLGVNSALPTQKCTDRTPSLPILCNVRAFVMFRYCSSSQTLRRTSVEDPAAVPHRMRGGDFRQWLPQKTGGCLRIKAYFMLSMAWFQTSGSPKVSQGSQGPALGQQTKVHVLRDLRTLNVSYPHLCHFQKRNISPPSKYFGTFTTPYHPQVNQPWSFYLQSSYLANCFSLDRDTGHKSTFLVANLANY